MGEENNWRRFEQLAMPHLDAAYNLALWITRNADDAPVGYREVFVLPELEELS